jgi:hypothetical protein
MKIETIQESRYNFFGKNMDLLKMIAELRAERAGIDDALVVLERLARSHGKRRGRPPNWMLVQRAASSSAPLGERKTRVLSAEVRKKMAEAQKKRWAAYRKTRGVAGAE